MAGTATDTDSAEGSPHWDAVYRRRGERSVSWFEETPELSLALIASAGLADGFSVVDVGGGASRLVDALTARSRVTVLDLSAAGMELARVRLGPLADDVEWVAADVTRWEPARDYDLWHDRAAFHFLIEPADQQAYGDVLRKAVRPGGVVIMGTFAPDGPDRCSGLPVARHDAASIAGILGPEFRLVETRRHVHETPRKATQAFQFSVFRRLSGGAKA